MKKILVAFMTMALMTISLSCNADRDRIITADQLPAAAREFIKQYFPEQTVTLAKKDKDLIKVTYEVLLNDGTEIEFDSKGEWDKIDRETIAVPAALIPEAIATYVSTSFPAQTIVKIDKEKNGYEIELSGGIELRFNKSGALTSVDD